MTFNLYVDESGDEGLISTLSGEAIKKCSPLFFLGGFLIEPKYEQKIRNDISEVEAKVGNLHFTQLSHEKRTYFCKKIAEYPIICFGLISDKSGTRRNGYLETLTPEKFYNKNVKYLFEKVGDFCSINESSVEYVFFEKKAAKDYQRLARFLIKVRENNFDSRSKNIGKIELGRINARTKKEEPLLKIADAIAFSLHKVCMPHSLGFTEPRYFNEISTSFFCNESGVILNAGLRIVPDLDGLTVDNDTKRLLYSAVNATFSIPAKGAKK